MSICDVEHAVISFQITPALPHLPSPRVLVVETTSDAAYCFHGAERDGPRYCVFQYTLAGRGRFEAGGTTWDLPPGTGFLCDIRDPAYTYSMHEEATEPWRFLYLQMVGDATHLMVQDLVNAFGYVYRLAPHKNPIRKLERWLASDFAGVLSTGAATSVVLDLLVALMESARDAQGPVAGSHLVHQALTLLSARPQEGWNASLLAQELRISREHLSRLFDRHLGRSPYDYIREYRVRRATFHLRNSTDSIKEVAYQSGFSSPEAFSKTFRQVMGMSPRQYRS